MTTLPGETVVLEADNKTLTLTSHRVRYAMRRTGRARVISVMLESITSCELTHATHPVLLVLAILAVLGGFALHERADSTALIVGVVTAIALAAIYVGTRRQVLRVASPSSRIDVLLVGMSLDQATSVIDSIERAKDARYTGRSVRRASRPSESES